MKENCIFCKIANHTIDSKILFEDDKVIVFLDMDQTNGGHTLIIPKHHIEDIKEVENDMLSHMYEVAKNIGDKIMNKLNKTGLTYVINYGTSQEVKHLHLHIIPELSNKDNMDIEDVYNRLK